MNGQEASRLLSNHGRESWGCGGSFSWSERASVGHGKFSWSRRVEGVLCGAGWRGGKQLHKVKQRDYFRHTQDKGSKEGDGAP